MNSEGRLTRSLAALVGAVALAATLVTSCGIDADPEPRAIPVTTTSSTIPTTEPRGDQDALIYMVKNTALVPITRQLPAHTAREVMNSLLVPPSGGEGQGLSSSIPSNTELIGITGPEDGLVSIDLSTDFEDTQAEARILALGQIVMSETLVPGVTRVEFSIDGEPLSIFSPKRGDVEVVDACDYQESLANPEGDGSDLTIQQKSALVQRQAALDLQC